MLLFRIGKGFLLFGLLLWLAIFIQPINEWRQLAYASSSDAALAGSLRLTKQGKVILYKTHPVVTADISTYCPDPGNGFTEQGCYLPDENKIYVKQISPRFSASQNVALAHEMLHAAYSKLSTDEKDNLNQLLDSAFAGLNDPILNDLMSHYDQIEPGQKYNELHSILGTQYQNLPPALENYYSQYFLDRRDLAAAYTNDQKQIDTAVANLKNSQAKVDTLSIQTSKLMDTYVQSDEISSDESLNLYQQYQSSVKQYREAVYEYLQVQKNYSELVGEYNGQAVTEAAL
jgi:hypothetical protein